MSSIICPKTKQYKNILLCFTDMCDRRDECINKNRINIIDEINSVREKYYIEGRLMPKKNRTEKSVPLLLVPKSFNIQKFDAKKLNDKTIFIVGEKELQSKMEKDFKIEYLLKYDIYQLSNFMREVVLTFKKRRLELPSTGK